MKKLWVMIVIDTSIAFKEVTPCSCFSGRKGKNFKFEGYDIIWFNGDEKHYPFVVIPYDDPADYSKEIEIGCRFLSLAAYELNRPIKRLNIYAGKGLGRQPRKLGDHRVSADTLMDLSLPGNQKKKLLLVYIEKGWTIVLTLFGHVYLCTRYLNFILGKTLKQSKSGLMLM